MSDNFSKQKIVLFDVDNTIINGYTQKYFIEYLFKEGIINIIVLFFSYLWFFLYKIHLVKNVGKAINSYIFFLDGWDENRLSNVVDIFFKLYLQNRVYNKIKILVDEYKKNGDEIVLISTSLEPIVDRIAKYLGVKKYFATKLEINGGLYTGRVYGLPLVGEEKLRVVKSILLDCKNKNMETYFYSDHFSDWSLLDFVDHPFVVNPDKILYNKANRMGWPIIKLK